MPQRARGSRWRASSRTADSKSCPTGSKAGCRSHLDDFLDGLGLASLLACILRQQRLTQPDAGRRGFDELVVLDVFQRLLERHLPGGLEDDVLVTARRPHV